MTIPTSLDPIDRAIISELRVDGRLSNVDLAARVGLTPAPCLRRVKRLEGAGVITGYRARLDPEAAGLGFSVSMLVQVTMSSREVVEEFEQAVAQFPEVADMRRVYGETDYVIRVDVADSNAYERFLNERLYALGGVNRVISYPTMKTLKSVD